MNSKKEPSGIVRGLALLWQLTWGFPQSLAGFLLFLKYRKCPRQRYRTSIMTDWDSENTGISLGPFIFTGKDNERLVTHEYGHSLQSLILGPLYLFVIGIPSVIWCRGKVFQKLRQEKHIGYFEFYTERFAEFFADKFREKKA